MKIQGIERLSLVDYDGYTACTVFLAGCNLRCPYCQNAALIEGNLPEEISESAFFDYLKKRRGLLDAVCISGGEPTLRGVSLLPFCRRIKALGYRVKLDTNGTAPRLVRTLIDEGLIDYVAMDMKAPPRDYPSLLLSDEDAPERIRETAALLLEGRISYEFRTTLVAEMIDEDGILAIGELIRGADKLFLQKFEDRGGNLVEALSPVPRETAEHYAALLQKTVKRVSLRGYA